MNTVENLRVFLNTIPEESEYNNYYIGINEEKKFVLSEPTFGGYTVKPAVTQNVMKLSNLFCELLSSLKVQQASPDNEEICKRYIEIISRMENVKIAQVRPIVQFLSATPVNHYKTSPKKLTQISEKCQDYFYRILGNRKIAENFMGYLFEYNKIDLEALYRLPSNELHKKLDILAIENEEKIAELFQNNEKPQPTKSNPPVQQPAISKLSDGFTQKLGVQHWSSSEREIFNIMYGHGYNPKNIWEIMHQWSTVEFIDFYQLVKSKTLEKDLLQLLGANKKDEIPTGNPPNIAPVINTPTPEKQIADFEQRLLMLKRKFDDVRDCEQDIIDTVHIYQDLCEEFIENEKILATIDEMMFTLVWAEFTGSHMLGKIKFNTYLDAERFTPARYKYMHSHLNAD